jgi:hypothetical protein
MSLCDTPKHENRAATIGLLSRVPKSRLIFGAGHRGPNQAPLGHFARHPAAGRSRRGQPAVTQSRGPHAGGCAARRSHSRQPSSLPRRHPVCRAARRTAAVAGAAARKGTDRRQERPRIRPAPHVRGSPFSDPLPPQTGIEVISRGKELVGQFDVEAALRRHLAR